MQCFHCGEMFGPFQCHAGEGCDSWIVDSCPECHAELAHGEISMESVHVCGNSSVLPDEETQRYQDQLDQAEPELPVGAAQAQLPREVSFDMPVEEPVIRAVYPEEDEY